MHDAELVDTAVAGVGDAAHACAGFLNRKSWVAILDRALDRPDRPGCTPAADYATAC